MPLKPDREGDEVAATPKPFRPHTHRPDCWSEEVVVIAGVPRCPRCEGRPEVVVCTPIVCVSS